MPKATISKRVLDTLIRAKVSKLSGCSAIVPMPVAWKKRDSGGCNWTIPGWTGEARSVESCLDQLSDYLRFLRDQFDIPEDEEPAAR